MGADDRRVMDLPDARADVREALFGGTGAVRVWDLLGRASAAPFSAVLACELEPGGRVGAHVQQRDPEIVLCLEGEGTADVGGLARAMRPGAVVFVPLGASLAITNARRDAPLRYVIVKARAAP